MHDVDVESVDFSERPFKVVAGGTQYTADSVIVATGAIAIWLDLENETRLRGRGVSACATCDGFFFRDKKIAVVGGGDSALEEALFLTKFASEVVIIHRRDEFRGSRIMQNRAKTHPKISIEWNTPGHRRAGRGQDRGARADRHAYRREARDAHRGPLHRHRPQAQHGGLQGLPRDRRQGLPGGRRPHARSNVEGVFVAGDVHDHRYRQAVTAAGDGCRAAIDAERWLEEQADEARSATPAAGEAVSLA